MTVKTKKTPVINMENNENSQTNKKPQEKEKGIQNSKDIKTIETSTDQTVANPIENLITFISTDQNLLEESNEVIEKAKDDKKEITDRLKDLRRDVATLYKYATPEQKAKLDSLGFDMNQFSHGLNSVAQIALDILAKFKKQLTNEELYNEYVVSLKVGEEPVSYTGFNIKLRSPLNTQLIVRKVVDDGQGSRTDIIYLNGGNLKN